MGDFVPLVAGAVGRVSAVIHASSTRGLELQNGVAAILVGVVLLLPPETLGVAPGYALMRTAPESLWALSFLGTGVAQVSATLADVILMRRIAAAILGVIYAILGASIIVANPTSAIAPIVLTLAAGQWGAWWQARQVL